MASGSTLPCAAITTLLLESDRMSLIRTLLILVDVGARLTLVGPALLALALPLTLLSNLC